jgi:predicted TIM-barrel fold metal-dependent hydrolase
MTSKTPIIDADAHVSPPPDFWGDYLPGRLRGKAPRLEHGDDADYVVFEGRRKKLNLMHGQAGRSGEQFKTHGKLSDMRAGGWLVDQRLAEMDLERIDGQVLFGGGPLGTHDRELYVESFRAYNRWLADFCGQAGSRLRGVAYLPMQDVDEAIGLMREAAALGYAACNIPAFPQTIPPTSENAAAAQMLALTGDATGERQYDQGEFDKFWAAAVDLDMTITIHLGARSARFDQPRHFMPDLLMTKLTMAEPVAIMIFGCVFQRHPDLRFVTVESGGGWLAFAAEYMDNTWDRQRFWTKSELREKPSTFMERNIFASFIRDRTAVLTRHLPGAKNIMWSSDYPHSETSYPHSQEWIQRQFEGVPEDEKAWMCGGLAAKLYRFT